jgi:protease I
MDLSDKKIAILVHNYFEEIELTGPREELMRLGAVTHIIAPKSGVVQGMHHVDKAREFSVNHTLDEVDFDDYDALVIPGGVINSDHLRMEMRAREWINVMINSSKPVAVICHGPWLLVSAGAAKGRTLTSYPTLQDDIRNAGGTWVDQAVVVDGLVITSRKPDDIPAFNAALIDALQTT